MSRRRNIIQNFESSSLFTSYREKHNKKDNINQRVINGCNVPDSVIESNDEFFSLLDSNGVLRIGWDFFRYDYCLDKVFVIAVTIAFEGNNYNDFLNGNTNNSNVGWFPTYVDVAEAVASGFRTMPDPKSVENNDIFKQGAPGNNPIDEWKYFFDWQDENGSTPNDTRMDGKLSYDKFGLYFHFYGKEKYQRYKWLGWQTVNYGTRNWLVDYQYQYQRKGQSNTSGAATLIPPIGGENKVDKTFYSGNRGLLKYYARWDVKNFTNYHNIYRKAYNITYHIGTFQAFPDLPIDIYNYSFNQIINYGTPNYFIYNYGY